MLDDHVHPYRLGIPFDVMPVPVVPEHCVSLDAGPIRFTVESRTLTNDIMMRGLADAGMATPDPEYVASLDLDDSGMSLHVSGVADGLEYLRFDCFESEPHYHYIDHARGVNTVVRIDDVAEPDPAEWAIARMESRLPEMLEQAGASELAAVVRARWTEVEPAIAPVAELLRGNRR
ncbi:DUF7700 domain-containing protein [Rhodococcus sp. SGAir0479]|uniref:DUF7700 domain-containing protein n=1 Tax=Rhodococcus sp. SGAir0479 TaxID=2567884 RepID=UPI0010CD046C|nr:hypothetical protein [Rhodococcus sp. SGAir0479]QCQ90368.1 hypothetical protein E7742_03460 [Rhodococcus sp. SGAir0479]